MKRKNFGKEICFLVLISGLLIVGGWALNGCGASGNQQQKIVSKFIDSDNDGLSDSDEITKYHTGLANRDTDGDGLNDGDEVNKYGTDPTNSDTDSDGYSDGQEVSCGSDPLDPNNPGNNDADGDGLTDFQETCIYNCDPSNPDTDGDGWSDWAEAPNGLSDCRDPLSVPPIPRILINEVFDFNQPWNIYSWIELYNTAGYEVDISWWYLQVEWGWNWVEQNYLLNEWSGSPIVIQPHGYMVLDFNAGTNTPTHRYNNWSRTFWNWGDYGSVELTSTSNAWITVDFVRWGGSTRTPSYLGTFWHESGPIAYSAQDHSLSRDSHSSDTDWDVDWSISPTTPGEINWLDSDGDGMPDWWEIQNSFNPNDPSDAAVDMDGDGLTNLEEFQNRTNPYNSDTDGDVIDDGAEVNTFGTNPNKADTDDDGLTDYQEICYDGNCAAYTPGADTDPNNPDTDSDIFPDGYEVSHGTDPLDNLSHGLIPPCSGGCVLLTVNGTLRLLDSVPRTDTTSYTTARGNCLAAGGDMTNFDETYQWQFHVWMTDSADVAYYSYEDAAFCAAHPGEWGSAPTCCGMIGDGFGWDDLYGCSCHDCDDGNNYPLDIFSNENNGGYVCVWRL